MVCVVLGALRRVLQLSLRRGLVPLSRTIPPAPCRKYHRANSNHRLRTKGGHNNTIALPFHTTLYDLKQPQSPPKGQLVERNGLRLFSPDAAMVRVPESFFRRNPIEAQVVLNSIKDVSLILRLLLDGDTRQSPAGLLALCGEPVASNKPERFSLR